MPNNTIELEFADGEYLFALPLERIDELQRKTGIGIGGLFARILKSCLRNPVTGQMLVDPSTGQMVLDPSTGEFYAADIVETLRQGLIGGGTGTVDGSEVKVTPVIATQLIKAYVLDRPLAGSWTLAATVLGACILGYDPPKKASAGAEPAQDESSEQTATSTTN